LASSGAASGIGFWNPGCSCEVQMPTSSLHTFRVVCVPGGHTVSGTQRSVNLWVSLMKPACDKSGNSGTDAPSSEWSHA